MCFRSFFLKLPQIVSSRTYASRVIGLRVCEGKKLFYGGFWKSPVLSSGHESRNTITLQSCRKSIKSRLDYSKVPKLDEKDLVEQFVRGDGPGGQATAKTNNAVVLKHKPTGIVVKCHETRSLWENKKRARDNLIMKLDNLLNGQDSIENQKRSLLAKKSANMARKKEKMAALKAAFKEREGID